MLYSCSPKKKSVPRSVEKQSKEIAGALLKKIDKNDSLLKQSVFFITENIKYQRFYNGANIEAYTDVIKEYVNDEETLIKKIGILKGSSFKPDKLYDDCNKIDINYLLNDIRNSVDFYKKCSWNREITQDVFNRYVLPYKIMEEPINYDWRSYFRDWYFNENDSTILNDSISLAAAKVHDWLYDKKKKFRIFYGGSHLKIPDLPATVLANLTVGSCHELTNVGIAAMRALDIPAANDFVPNYLNVNAEHEWAAVVIDSNHCIPFDITTEKINKIKKDYNYLAKVYRYNYMPNKDSHYYQKGKCNYLPDLFNNPFITDVTSSYVTTSNVSIPLRFVKHRDNEICYLSVFDNRKANGWIPVSWGNVENDTAYFSNIGRNGVYIASIIDKDGTVYINNPFILNEAGEVHYLSTDMKNTGSVKLLRKFGSTIFKIEHVDRMTKGKFQGANQPDFSDAITLYTIEKNPGEYFNDIPVNSEKRFKYVRYLSPKNSFGNVAEVEFYEKGNSNKLMGDIIGTDGSYLDDPRCTKSAAFDGKCLTYFDSKIADNSWTGLDLGDKREICRIRFIARNDMNAVQIGNRYELFYWGDSEWKSLGIQVPDTTFLIYENVPKNTVYWLRNYTEGQEERIFTYENGEQIWW